MKGVTTAESCCALCAAWDDCKVGIWHQRWHECYLKLGFVSERPSGRETPEITACVARPREEASEVPGAAEKLGATVWAPCYARNHSMPVLLDGARTLEDMGMRVIKVALFRPSWNYAVGSDWPPDESFETLRDVAEHQHFRELWDMRFDTYVLVAYSTAGGGSAGNMAAGYWVQGISEAKEAEEELQFYEAAAFFLERYPQKTFVFSNCEGDWEIRGGLGVQRAPKEAEFVAMQRWLRARQAGVTKARQRFRVPGAAGNVYLAAEVNLIAESLFEKGSNVVNRVLPFVQLDMVSYSSYDTQQDLKEFEAAMRYLASQHNRTASAPAGMAAVMLGEFGLPQRTMPERDVSFILGNVINSALAMGVAYLLFWETYCNECLPGPGCGADGRCRDKAVSVTELHRLNGFWLARTEISRKYQVSKTRSNPSRVSR